MGGATSAEVQPEEDPAADPWVHTVGTGGKTSKLVHRYIGQPVDASKSFSDAGMSGKEICVIASPKSTLNLNMCNICCPFTMLTQVPSGPTTLHHKWGKNMGVLRPGAHWCMPVWSGPTFVVSKQMIVYDAKPRQCPTKDHVFVDVNVSINLKIKPDLESVEKFAFEMGAARLDKYLYFQVEESLRTLVYGVTHERVNDLKSEFAMEMTTVLQNKLNMYGVEISSVKVTDVALPADLQKRLGQTTAFKTKIVEERKTHDYNLQQLNNEHAQKMKDVEQMFLLEEKTLKAQLERYTIEMDEKMAIAASERTVALEKAVGQKEVAITEAKGDIEVAVYTGRMNKNELVTSTEIEEDRRVRAAYQQADAKVIDSRSQMNSSKFRAQALEAEAEAAGVSAQQTEMKIRHEQRLRLATIDAELAAKGRRVISGEDGKSLMSGFVAVKNDLMART
mmetsp:Transcript_20841/g.48365  ORF Transcript_20841/g.48365 Transcript_20841/m.48365 type:complete len:449 (-) Transcript_20841:145-1491(-)